ncbi:amidohydrolase family protein [Pseudonocardia sp. HH130629-09]|uniref:amidohydrolase family protein n=1 Tax=Pseudonocardia sp. HH130629-09 TaxID=1641402 RepID=UPI0039C9196C
MRPPGRDAASAEGGDDVHPPPTARPPPGRGSPRSPPAGWRPTPPRRSPSPRCRPERWTPTATSSDPPRSSRSHRNASTPCDAGREDLEALHERLGIARRVVVQATCHGAGNSAMVDAVRSAGGPGPRVATVRSDVTDTELGVLHEAGVRGVRFNFVKRSAPGPSPRSARTRPSACSARSASSPPG